MRKGQNKGRYGWSAFCGDCGAYVKVDVIIHLKKLFIALRFFLNEVL